MLLRLVSTGLCAACVVLLATFPPIRIETPAPARATTLPLSIVDASAQVAPSGLAALVDLVRLVRLAPDEHIRAIDDRPLDGEVDADALLAERAVRAGEYIDLTVSNGTTERRVLVLVH
jgi:hypothetical protein